MNIDVSVIIVSYNTKKLTLAAVHSVHNSRSKYTTEIIVVDNNSTDGTVQELRKLGSTITLVENSTNYGFAKANNQGIRISRGAYIFLLNSDAEVVDDCIDRLVEFAQRHDDAGAVVPMLLNSDGSPQPSVFRLPTLWGAIKQYWLGQKGLYGQYVPTGNSSQKIQAAVMAAFLLTPLARKKVGLLNEKYMMYFEDLDYCRELARVGLSLYYLPNVKVIHHVGQSGKSLTDKNNQWRRLIPSSKLYHGIVTHYLIWFVMRTSQYINR